MAGRRTAALAGLTGLAAVVLAAVPAAAATVIGTTGAAQATAAPTSLMPGALESDSVVRVVTERSLTLSASLTVSIMDANGSITTKTLSAGACLQSHLLHFDAVGTSTAPSLSGTVSFSQPVLAVAPLTPLLDVTDGGSVPFGLPGTTYPTGTASRGVEPRIPVVNPNGDLLMLSSPTTVGFTFRTDGYDQARILTQCDPAAVVPEVPSPVLLSISAGGALALAAARRRRRDVAAAF